MATRQDPFVSLRALIVSAAGTVTVVLGLFNSVFAELVPPLENQAATIGWISLGALVALLLLATAARSFHRQAFAWIGGACALAGVILAFQLYLSYARDLRQYVVLVHFKAGQERLIRGEYHQEGLERLKKFSLDEIANSDPDGLKRTNLLWSRESQLQIAGRLEQQYVALVMAMIVSIFLSALLFSIVSRPATG